MSKSTGNYILPMELLSGENSFFEKSFESNIVRFCFSQAHYRSVLDISNDAMVASEKGYNRLMEAYKLLGNLKTSTTSTIAIASWKQSCYDAMNDDFNTPILIAQLFEGARFINTVNEGSATITAEDLQDLSTTLSHFIFDVLGMTNPDANGNSNSTEKLKGVVEMLIEMRNEARANKNFALSDEIRDKLLALGIQLKDGKEGTTFTA
jgi:cysteinyl-tRNA synthetase